MLTRILIGLVVLAALVHGLAPDVVPQNILPLALVILGLVYGAMSVDAEDATNYLVGVIAVGGAAASDVLMNIHMIGSYLDAIIDALSIGLWASVASILVIRIWNRLADSGEESAGSD